MLPGISSPQFKYLSQRMNFHAGDAKGNISILSQKMIRSSVLGHNLLLTAENDMKDNQSKCGRIVSGCISSFHLVQAQVISPFNEVLVSVPRVSWKCERIGEIQNFASFHLECQSFTVKLDTWSVNVIFLLLQYIAVLPVGRARGQFRVWENCRQSVSGILVRPEFLYWSLSDQMFVLPVILYQSKIHRESLATVSGTLVAQPQR